MRILQGAMDEWVRGHSRCTNVWQRDCANKAGHESIPRPRKRPGMTAYSRAAAPGSSNALKNILNVPYDCPR